MGVERKNLHPKSAAWWLLSSFLFRLIFPSPDLFLLFSFFYVEFFNSLFSFVRAGCVGPPTTTMRHGHLIDECLTDLVTGCRLQDAPLREEVISILLLPRSSIFSDGGLVAVVLLVYLFISLLFGVRCLNISPLSDVSGRPRITQPSTRRLPSIWSSPDLSR